MQNPIDEAMKHPRWCELVGRVLNAIIAEGWPVECSVRFSDWRFTSQEYIPPFAFSMPLSGEGGLSPEQEEWLRARQAFGHVRPLTFEGNGKRFTRTSLVVFDMPQQPKPDAMFHATPTKLVPTILASGLKPGRLTGVNTTKFPETHRWIHLFESPEHTTTRFLLLDKNKGRIPVGSYTILRVGSAGFDELLCDPFSVHGFVTRSDVIPPQHITPLNEVAVTE